MLEKFHFTLVWHPPLWPAFQSCSIFTEALEVSELSGSSRLGANLQKASRSKASTRRNHSTAPTCTGLSPKPGSAEHRVPAGAQSRRRHPHHGGKSGKTSGSCIQKGPCAHSKDLSMGRCEPCFGQSPGVLWEMGWRLCWLFIAGQQESHAGEKGCTNLQLTQGKH